ncbi:MAG: DUF169 domain-containing protein [Mailhella sp.]|nr:DUF169 domain-containing protein [Mailhella sp.]
MKRYDLTGVHDFFMRELRLMHTPVGIKFFFDEAELEEFRARGEHYSPVKPLTFCQAELGARMEGLTILLEMNKLWCSGARYVFGVDEINEKEIQKHRRFCTNDEQARQVVESKPRLDRAPLAIVLRPLRDMQCVPDVVHFCCDNMQAYHILDDWMGVRNVHPFRPSLCMNSAVCGGSVFCFQNNQANLTLACAGNYNSGKMERGEINVMIPGADVFAMVEHMSNRVEDTGGVSLTKKGHPFPGADICKNCPLINFKKGD